MARPRLARPVGCRSYSSVECACVQRTGMSCTGTSRQVGPFALAMPGPLALAARNRARVRKKKKTRNKGSSTIRGPVGKQSAGRCKCKCKWECGRHLRRYDKWRRGGLASLRSLELFMSEAKGGRDAIMALHCGAVAAVASRC